MSEVTAHPYRNTDRFSEPETIHPVDGFFGGPRNPEEYGEKMSTVGDRPPRPGVIGHDAIHNNQGPIDMGQVRRGLEALYSREVDADMAYAMLDVGGYVTGLRVAEMNPNSVPPLSILENTSHDTAHNGTAIRAADELAGMH